jgi:RimJ/RimL family protein N-acetyltransferase
MHGHIKFRPLTREDAEQIAGWRYQGEYSLYDIPEEQRAAAIDYMTDPSSGYFGAHDDGALMAFVSMGPDGRVPGWSYDESALDVGAGVRPDLTGQGRGTSFLRRALAFAESRAGGVPLRATIASWNERALKATERNGFARVGSFVNPAGMSFTVLERGTDCVSCPP